MAVSALAVAVRPSSRLEAAEVERPNIVFILTDDQRWDTIRGIMPVVESQILGRGLEFRNAFATNPLCCPSRASILTGNYAHTHGVWENFNGPNGGFAAFDDSSTIATWLDDGGYHTGLIGKYMNGYQVSGGTYIPPGWDEWYTLMDGDYYRFTVTDNGVQKYIPAQYSTDTFAFEAKTFIQHAPVDEPLFLMFNPRAPHGPYTPATRHDEAFADMAPYRSPSWQESDVRDKPRWLQKIEPAGAPRVKQYDREQIDSLESLLAVDEAVASILDALEQTGRLENTLIIYASDNGYEWGEHRLWGKNIPYDASLRLPLIMRWDAGILPGTSTSTVVANIDLAPTLAEIAGVTPPARVDGRSLTRFFADPSAAFGRKGILIEHAQGGKLPAYCGYRTEGELFVHYASGDEEYYRYSKDPYELQNRASMPSEQFDVAKLRSITRSRCTPMPPGMTWG
ncbi:MAG: sulfatase family protein [Acidimicrobiia bacterium]